MASGALRLLRALALLAALWASPAWAAAAFDAASNNGCTNGAASPSNWTHTPVGTPTALLVYVSIDAATQPTTVTVTYNSVSVTFQDSQTDASGNEQVRLYALGAPSAGPQTVSVAWTGGAAVEICAGAMTFTGTDTSGFLNTIAKAQGAGATASVTITSATGEVATWGVVVSSQAPTTPNQTGQWAIFATGGGGGGQTANGAAPNITGTWATGTHNWSEIGVSVKAAAGGGGASVPSRTLTGVGQ